MWSHQLSSFLIVSAKDFPARESDLRRFACSSDFALELLVFVSVEANSFLHLIVLTYPFPALVSGRLRIDLLLVVANYIPTLDRRIKWFPPS